MAVAEVCRVGYYSSHGIQEANREIQEWVRARYSPKGHVSSDLLSPTSPHLCIYLHPNDVIIL